MNLFELRRCNLLDSKFAYLETDFDSEHDSAKKKKKPKLYIYGNFFLATLFFFFWNLSSAPDLDFRWLPEIGIYFIFAGHMRYQA